MTDIIFFGNGLLSDLSLDLLKKSGVFNIVFHAKTKADLLKVKQLKSASPHLFGVLASFGHLITDDLLSLFEPIGILNLHPSLLPKYRGASPIETAILNGDKDFSVSIMKIAKDLDAGPIYFQTTIPSSNFSTALPEKTEIYSKLATTGINWLTKHISKLKSPTPQDNHLATYTTKFDKTMSMLNPQKTAKQLLNQVRAFQDFPKSKFVFNQHLCIIHKAHINTDSNEIQTAKIKILCGDHHFLIIDELQPIGKRKMNAQSFYNGYMK